VANKGSFETRVFVIFRFSLKKNLKHHYFHHVHHATNYLPQTVPVITSRHGTHRKHRCSVAVPLLRSRLLLRERGYRADA
jgi:hypothetical protein